ncbi:hypothetical protein D3C71_2180330 [compost metagenome]
MRGDIKQLQVQIRDAALSVMLIDGLTQHAVAATERWLSGTEAYSCLVDNFAQEAELDDDFEEEEDDVYAEFE